MTENQSGPKNGTVLLVRLILLTVCYTGTEMRRSDITEQTDTNKLINSKCVDNRTSLKVLYNTVFTPETFITQKTAKLFVL